MNPVYWLLIVIACAVALSTVVAAIFYGIGWDHCDTHHAEEQERHRHRERDRVPGYMLELPRSGLLPVEQPAVAYEAYLERLERFPESAPVPMWQSDTGTWRFAGGWDQGPSGSAEYELLTQTAVQPASPVEGEPPIDTGELLAITDRVESWIAQWTAQGNYDRHTMKDVG